MTTNPTMTQRERLANDFLLAFFREFEEAQRKTDPADAYFIIKMDEFDNFLVAGGFLHKLPSAAASTEERVGLVAKRNTLRDALNRASSRALHGSPIYSVKSHVHNEALRVDLDVRTAVSFAPDSMEDVVRFVGNKVKAMEADWAFVQTVQLPQHIRDDIARGQQTLEITMGGFLPMIENLSNMLADSKNKALRWQANNRNQLEGPDATPSLEHIAAE